MLQRLFFKDVLLRNDNKKQHIFFFIVHCIFHFSWELATPFKISKTAVYICPFKTNYKKMKTIFSLKVTIKVTFA